MKGSNPRATGRDLRSRFVAPRQLPYPTNPRFVLAVSEAARTAVGAPAAGGAVQPHRPAPAAVLGRPWAGTVGDSDWRRRAARTSGPCVVCGDAGWVEGEDGTVEVCAERVRPDEEGEPP